MSQQRAVIYLRYNLYFILCIILVFGFCNGMKSFSSGYWLVQILIILFSAQNSTSCSLPETFNVYVNACALPCPNPLVFNPTVMNCTTPCFIPFLSDAKINGQRITMAVIGWFNVVFISAVLLLYTLRAPKRWITFPNNLMLTMLAVSLPVGVYCINVSFFVIKLTNLN